MNRPLLTILVVIECLVGYPQSAVPDEDETKPMVDKDLVKSHSKKLNIFPFVFYTPEIELGFGAGGIITFYTSEEKVLRPSKATFVGYYSSSKQYSLGFAPQAYFMKNNLFVSAKLNYSDKIYFTPDIDNPEVPAKMWGIETELQFPTLFRRSEMEKLGFIFDYQNVSLKDEQQIPEENRPHTLGLGPVWILDTRDNIFYPSTGGIYRAEAVFFSRDFGSDYDFNRFEIDLRKYMSIDPAEDQVLALQFYTEMVGGTPPFYRLPPLGGSMIMRGYKSGELRDKNLVAAQMEFRTRVLWRIGAVAFFGMGEVFEEFGDFRLDELKTSLGVGLRFKFNPEENINLRADFGFGDDTRGVYFGVEEAF